MEKYESDFILKIQIINENDIIINLIEKNDIKT